MSLLCPSILACFSETDRGVVVDCCRAGYSVARAGDGLSVLCQSADDVGGTVQAGRRRPDLPDYRLNDISEHRTADRGIWVTFGDGVYDITDFMVGHPGGDKISLAAGGSVEPFWDLYAIHKTDHVAEILETLRIGNIHPDDVSAVAAAVAQSSSDDPYSHEPRRHPALRVNASKPFNAETPLQLLVDEFITPNELFYVRNHLPVPRSAVDDAAAAKMKGKSASGSGAEIEVSGEGLRRPVNLSIADLRRRFASHTVTTTMPCAGNRRSNMKADDDRGSVRGLPWGIGAVGTARWTGVLLSDVLQWAGAREDQVSHVLFQGRDTDHEGQPYETSIPAATAFDPRRDVLLAYEMNGRELPVDHGYPLRVIVPGTVGARQVKWLRRIVLSHDESQSFWQQKDYKTVNPSTSWEAVDLSQVQLHAEILLSLLASFRLLSTAYVLIFAGRIICMHFPPSQ